MNDSVEPRGTRSASIKRWAALGVVVLAAMLAVTLHFRLGSVAGTVIGKEMAGPNCKTTTVGGFAGHNEVTCSDATHTLLVRDSTGRDIEVGVDQRTYEATRVGAAYPG